MCTNFFRHVNNIYDGYDRYEPIVPSLFRLKINGCVKLRA